jgi:hypothetical protein
MGGCECGVKHRPQGPTCSSEHGMKKTKIRSLLIGQTSHVTHLWYEMDVHHVPSAHSILLPLLLLFVCLKYFYHWTTT